MKPKHPAGPPMTLEKGGSKRKSLGALACLLGEPPGGLVGEGRMSFRDVRAEDATVECLSRNTVASVTRISCLTLLLVATEAVPAPMTFKNISTGGNHCCWWTAAEGEITDDTPREFERLFKTLSSPIRFNSPGGSLFAALELGSLMRKNGGGWPHQR